MTSPLVATPADNPGVEVCSAPGGGQGDCSKTSPYKNNRIRPSSAARSSTPVTLNTSGLNVCPFPLLRHVRVGARLDLEPRGRVGGGGADGRRDHQEAGDAHGGVADVALELLQVAGRQLVDALLALVVPHEDVAAAADPEAAVAVVGAVHGPVGEEDLAVAAGQLDQVAVVQLARRRRGGDIAEDHAVEVVGSPASSRMAPSWAPVSVSSSLSHPTRVISIPSVSFTPATIERDLEHGLEHVRALASAYFSASGASASRSNCSSSARSSTFRTMSSRDRSSSGFDMSLVKLSMIRWRYAFVTPGRRARHHQAASPPWSPRTSPVVLRPSTRRIGYLPRGGPRSLWGGGKARMARARKGIPEARVERTQQLPVIHRDVERF